MKIRAFQGRVITPGYEEPMPQPPIVVPQPTNIHEIRFDVWCLCGELISVYGEEDGTIEHRCGVCDKYIISGTYTLTLTTDKAKDD